MDVRSIENESKWDDMRLGELLDKTNGWRFSYEIVKEIGPKISRCQCVRDLAIYLNARHVLDHREYCELTESRTTYDGASKLIKILLNASQQKTRGEDLISKLFLALLDMFCDKHNIWCHYTAFHVVREQAIKKLQLCSSMSQNFDLAEVIKRVPSIEMSTEMSSQLRCNLHLSNNEPTGTDNLKEVVECSHQSKSLLSLEDLVRALMLTPGLGRYVTNLLPFHKSYAADVWHFLKLLGKKWVEFADFIGFNEEEVDTILSSAPNDVHDQIKNFSKVWRMPDLTERKNKKILDEVLRLAGITQEATVENAPQFSSTHPFQQEVKGQVHHHYYLTVHRNGSGESLPSTPENTPHAFGLLFRSSSGTQSNPNSHGGNMQRLHSQQSGSSDHSGANSPLTTRQLSQLSDSNSDISGSFEYIREHSMSSEVSGNSVASALKREHDTPPDVTTRPESTKWTGSKRKVSCATTHQEHKQSTSRRVLPITPVGRNQQAGDEVSCRNTATRQMQSQVQKPTSAKAPLTRQKQLQREPTKPHHQPPEETQPTTPSQLPPEAVVTQTATTLGYGSYGEVVEVKYGEECYAAKKYYERHAPPAKLYEVFGSEQGFVSKLNHPNVVPYLGIGQLDGLPVIVMERLQTNFANFMKDRSPALETRISVMCDVARGLEYAHSQDPPILHCDLMANNVLITADDRAKIADFGNSRMVDITKPELLQPLTRDYMPPEAEHMPHPLLKPTYVENGKIKARSEIERRHKYVVQINENLKDRNSPLMDLVNICLSDEPEERPTINVVLQKLHY